MARTRPRKLKHSWLLSYEQHDRSQQAQTGWNACADHPHRLSRDHCRTTKGNSCKSAIHAFNLTLAERVPFHPPPHTISEIALMPLSQSNIDRKSALADWAVLEAAHAATLGGDPQLVNYSLALSGAVARRPSPETRSQPPVANYQSRVRVENGPAVSTVAICGCMMTHCRLAPRVVAQAASVATFALIRKRTTVFRKPPTARDAPGR